jgi:copper(I)-binding protein
VFWSSRAGARPRRLLIVAAAALIPAVAGCEAGDNAPVLQWHYPTEGSGTAVHGISIRNVFVLGAPGSETLPAGQSAGLFLGMVNTGSPDRLVSVQAPGTASAVTIPQGGVSLPTNKVVLLSGPQPQAVLTSVTRPLTGGSVLTIILNFQRAGSVSLRVPVVSQSGSYATLSPAPSPTPTPTATPAGKGKRKHHPAASPSPSRS